MTQQEINVAMEFAHEFELIKWMFGLMIAGITALAGAIIFMYKDHQKLNDKMIYAFEKNTEAFNRLELSNQRLADVVDRQESTTQNLEKLILAKLVH